VAVTAWKRSARDPTSWVLVNARAMPAVWITLLPDVCFASDQKYPNLENLQTYHYVSRMQNVLSVEECASGRIMSVLKGWPSTHLMPVPSAESVAWEHAQH